jgi:gas vesicle protein
MYGRTDRNGFGITGALLAGAVIGGGAAMLMAPQTGPQLRRRIWRYADKTRDELTKTWGSAVDQGIEYAERGQRALRDAEKAMGTAIERSKEYLDAGKGMLKKATKQEEPSMFEEGVSTAGAVLAGIIIGGALALLMAPQTGSEFREQIRDYAERAKDELALNRG